MLKRIREILAVALLALILGAGLAVVLCVGALAVWYGAATPTDLIKLMLLPGEIEDLGREIEQLSGYRTATLEVLKKK